MDASFNQRRVMTGLILKPEGWHLIPDVPEEPIICNLTQQDQCEDRSEFRNSRFVCKCTAKEIDYAQALQQAISSAIPVQNQDFAFECFVNVEKDWGAGNPYIPEPEPGKIYPIEVNYRIRDKCKYMEIDGSCPDCFRGSLCEKVAILHPPEGTARICPHCGSAIKWPIILKD